MFSDDSRGGGVLVQTAAVTYADGVRLSRHHHLWGQLAFCSRGVMRVASARAAWLSPPTRAIWLPPCAPHEIVMQGEVATAFLYLAGPLCAQLPTEARVLEVAPFLRELILHVLAEGSLRPDRPRQARLAGVLADTLAQANPLDLSLPLPRDRRALALAERLQDAATATRSLAALSRECGASLRTQQRLFSAETGLALASWRQKARLMQAAAELSAGASVDSAAFRCGYRSQSAFISAFRRQFAVTPGRFRPPRRMSPPTLEGEQAASSVHPSVSSLRPGAPA